MKYTIEQVAVEFVEMLVKNEFTEFEGFAPEFSARGAITATATSARMAAVARPPKPQRCRWTTDRQDYFQRDGLQ